MAGLLFAPDPRNDTTSGVGWAPSYTGPQTTARATGTAATWNGYGSASAPYTGGGQPSVADPNNSPTVAQWDAYMAKLNTLLAGATGLERDKMVAEYKDAQKGRDNALEIAQIQSRTSRYGVDTQNAYNLQKLQQDQAQFQSTHGLDLANAYTKFASSPDMMFARQDFLSALDRVGQGLTPTAATSQPNLPHANTWQDFSALTGFGSLPAVQAGTTPSAANPPAAGGSASGAGGAGTGTDPRLTAAGAVMRALPPSGDPGTDGTDYAALNAIYHLYSAAAPGSVERLGAARQKIAEAGLARAGFDPATVSQDYTRAGVGQGSAMAA